MNAPRYTPAGLQRLCHDLCLELIRPASAKLSRGSLKTLCDRFDHMEGLVSELGADIEAHIGSHTPQPIADRSSTLPDGVSLPLTVVIGLLLVLAIGVAACRPSEQGGPRRTSPDDYSASS